MARPSVLMTMFNIAEWGGLHENVWYSCVGMVERGWDVTVACRSGQLVDRLRADGVRVHEVASWDDVSGDIEALSSKQWDIVHSHPFASRKLALAVARKTGAPLVSTFHGNYLDGLKSWQQHASVLIAVSRAHAGLLTTVPGVGPERVTVVANAVRDVLLDRPGPDAATQLNTPERRVVVASRLDRDKHALLECVDAITDIARDQPAQRWTVEVLGDGGSRGDLTSFLDELVCKAPHIDLRFAGWVDSDEVPDRLSGATLAVASGRGAVQALAIGTPVVAFGSQGVYGLQHGNNLDNGLWGNFGGFPLDGRAVSDLRADVQRLLADSDFYGRVQTEGRIAVRSHLLQSDVDHRLDVLHRRVLDDASAQAAPGASQRRSRFRPGRRSRQD